LTCTAVEGARCGTLPWLAGRTRLPWLCRLPWLSRLPWLAVGWAWLTARPGLLAGSGWRLGLAWRGISAGRCLRSCSLRTSGLGAGGLVCGNGWAGSMSWGRRGCDAVGVPRCGAGLTGSESARLSTPELRRLGAVVGEEVPPGSVD
jgi:hypothetical protein